MKRDAFTAMAGKMGFAPGVADKCVEVAGSVRMAARLLVDAQGQHGLSPAEQQAVALELADVRPKAISASVESTPQWLAANGVSRSMMAYLVYAEPKTRDECLDWQFTFGLPQTATADDSVAPTSLVPICQVSQTALTDDIFDRLMNTTQRCTKERYGAVRHIDQSLAGSNAIYRVEIASVAIAPRRKAGCLVSARQVVRVDVDDKATDQIMSIDQLKLLLPSVPLIS